MNADQFFLEAVTDAEKLLRRTPASAARLPEELHRVVLGPHDHLTCPNCRTRFPGPRPPLGVMVECPACLDGLVVA